MEKLKQYVVFTVLGCLLVLVAGWFLLVSPKHSQAADLRTQAASQVTANAQLATQLQVLKAQAKDLPRQQAKLASVAAHIPDNPALPGLVRALVKAGQAAGIELVSMTPGQPTPMVAPAAAAPVAPAAPAAGAAAPAAAAPAAAAKAAVAAASAGQLASIPLTLSVAGNYFQVEQFLAQLESLARSMRVTTVTMNPGANPLKEKATSTSADDGKNLVANISGQVFMAMNRAPATAVVAPAAPVVGTGVTPVAPVAPAKK